MLHIAAYRGYEDIVQLLVDIDANIDARDEFGWTPIMYAVTGGRTNIIKVLVSKGADITVFNS